MKTKLNNKSALIALTALLLAMVSIESYGVGVTERSSVASDGTQGNNRSIEQQLSADGRFVAFGSEASNLVSNDSNNVWDIFVMDRITKKTSRVSVNSGGLEANSDSANPSISGDGRFVVFSSWASNLVPDDSNNEPDIFVHDRQTGQTKRVNVDPEGNQANGYSGNPNLSTDGRFIAYSSVASNLVYGDTPNSPDVFVHDLQTQKTTRVSANFLNQQSNASFAFFPKPSLSADGRFVSFESDASDLVFGDIYQNVDVFVHDRMTGQTEQISVSSSGEQSDSSNLNSSMTPDGRFVVFNSSSNLAVDDTDNLSDIYIRDRQTEETTRVSSFSGGNNYNASISADGRLVAFQTDDIPNQTMNIFLHDRLTNITTPISIDTNGVRGDYGSTYPSISADGRYVGFASYATNLVSNDTNGAFDIFVRDRLLDTVQQANLKVATTSQPISLAPAGTGAYTYTITNSSAKAQPVNLLHLVSKGVATGFTPSQGVCRRYATTSLCKFGNVPAGASVTLKANVKVNSNQLRQKVVVSARPIDPQPANNSVSVTTSVK